MLTNLHFSRIAYNFVRCVNKGRRQKRGNFVWYIPQNRRTLPLPLSQWWYNNGTRNIMEDQYPLIYLSIILKSYLVRKRRLADGDTKRKLADTQTDTLT